MTAATNAATTTRSGMMPRTRDAINAALSRAVSASLAADDRLAVLTIALLARAVRDHRADADTVVLDWADQDDVLHLRVAGVRDAQGNGIPVPGIEDDMANASNLTDHNAHAWEAFVTNLGVDGPYALDIAATLNAAATLPDPGDTGSGGDQQPPACSEPAEHRVEVVSYRDPDDGTDLRVFIDGTELDSIDWYEADPGTGHTLTEWRAAADDHAAIATPHAAAAIRAAWTSGENSDHVAD